MNQQSSGAKASSSAGGLGSLAALNAQDLMTPDPVTVSHHSSIEEAVSLMSANDIRHLPVMDGKKLVGMLSDRDLRESLPSYQEIFSDPAVARNRFGSSIQPLYRADYLSVEPDAGLAEIVELLVDEKIGAVPVVDPRSSQLVGIISYVDILKAIEESLG